MGKNEKLTVNEHSIQNGRIRINIEKLVSDRVFGKGLPCVFCNGKRI